MACATSLYAMNQAAKRIMAASNWFNDYWDRLTEEQARATVQHLRELRLLH